MGTDAGDGSNEEEYYSRLSSEARKHVWMGAIPLLVHLHESEVTSLPAPTPFLVLAPRNGYLPLLADTIKPHFQSTLPPGNDSVWFDYEGLPLKWHIPTGVLFDLLCAEPERPWNLTIHFRAYPSEVLSQCEGEESVRWNFINALKEASYVMYGSTKTVMNLSQNEQSELWKSVVKGDLENYDLIFHRLKPGMHMNSFSAWSSGKTASKRPSVPDLGAEGRSTSKGSDGHRPGRLPLRFYIRTVSQSSDDLYDCPPVASWDQLVYTTKTVDIPKEQDTVLTLRDALMKVVPHLFSPLPSIIVDDPEYEGALSKEGPSKVADHGKIEGGNLESDDRAAEHASNSVTSRSRRGDGGESSLSRKIVDEESLEDVASLCVSLRTHASDASPGSLVDGQQQFQGIVRIQGIELNLDIPLDWVARNLCAPELFIHLCICTWAT